MEIVFASSKGAQYRYFKSLCGRLSCVSRVVTLNPVFYFSIWGAGLTKELILNGIEFHVLRKQAKYTGVKLPNWLWVAYKCRAALRFSIIYLRFAQYFIVHQPKIVGLWNGHRLPEMAIKSAALRYGVKVLHFENGLLPDTTTADFSGVNDLNSVPRNANFYLNANNHPQAKHFNLIARAPHKSKRSLGLPSVDLTTRYLFAPFQVGFDSQVLLNSPWIQSMDAFFQTLCEMIDLIEDKAINLVIKEHPSDPHSFRSYYNRHPRIKFSMENTELLIKHSQGVVTINSSVGLESILLGKKVIVVGEACYKIDGLVREASSVNQLVCAVNELSKWKASPILRAEFIAYLDSQYCIPGAWQHEAKRPTAEHVKWLDALIFDGLCVIQTKPSCAVRKNSADLDLQLNIQ